MTTNKIVVTGSKISVVWTQPDISERCLATLVYPSRNEPKCMQEHRRGFRSAVIRRFYLIETRPKLSFWTAVRQEGLGEDTKGSSLLVVHHNHRCSRGQMTLEVVRVAYSMGILFFLCPIVNGNEVNGDRALLGG